MNSLRLEWVDNCVAWGPVLGRMSEFPDLVKCGHEHYRNSKPGMFVHGYDGTLQEMKKRGENRPGFGIIVAVVPHENPRGDNVSSCLVLWNFV